MATKKNINFQKKFMFLDKTWYKVLMLGTLFCFFALIFILSFFTYYEWYNSYTKEWYSYAAAIYYVDSVVFIILYYSLMCISSVLLIIYNCKKNKNKIISFMSCIIYLIASILLLIGASICAWYGSYDINIVFLIITIVNLLIFIVFSVFETLRMIYHKENKTIKITNNYAYDKLMKLKELFDNGIITEEEFLNTKKKYIDYI